MRWAPGEPGRRNWRWQSCNRGESGRISVAIRPPTGGRIGSSSLAFRATQLSRDATDA